MRRRCAGPGSARPGRVGGVGGAGCDAAPSHRGRGGDGRLGDRRARRLHARPRSIDSRRRVLPGAGPLAQAAGAPHRSPPRDGGRRGWEGVRARGIHGRRHAAANGLRPPAGPLAPTPVDAVRTRRRGRRRREREDRGRGRRDDRSDTARPERALVRPADTPVVGRSRPDAARAPRGRLARRDRLRDRGPHGRARHEPHPLRVLSPRRPELAQTGARSRPARRNGRGGPSRPHRVRRRRGAGRDDRGGARLPHRRRGGGSSSTICERLDTASASRHSEAAST